MELIVNLLIHIKVKEDLIFIISINSKNNFNRDNEDNNNKN
jgi:hypothetical protein